MVKITLLVQQIYDNNQTKGSVSDKSTTIPNDILIINKTVLSAVIDTLYLTVIHLRINLFK